MLYVEGFAQFVKYLKPALEQQDHLAVSSTINHLEEEFTDAQLQARLRELRDKYNYWTRKQSDSFIAEQWVAREFQKTKERFQVLIMNETVLNLPSSKKTLPFV